MYLTKVDDQTLLTYQCMTEALYSRKHVKNAKTLGFLFATFKSMLYTENLRQFRVIFGHYQEAILEF